MNPEIVDEYYTPLIKRLTLTWYGILLSGPIYLCVAYGLLIPGVYTVDLKLDPNIFKPILILIGIISCVLSVTVVEKKLINKLHKSNTLADLYREYMRMVLIQISLIEVINILGLHNFLLFKNIKFLIGCVFVGIIFKIFVRPNKIKIVNIATQLIEDNKIKEEGILPSHVT